MDGPIRLFGQIQKVEESPDGTIHVHGIASTESVDDQGEIVTASAMREAIPGYLRFPAVREMHGLSAAGRAIECNCGDDDITRIVAHVVDPVAITKVKNRIYNGFSIGGRVLEREAGNYKVISKLALHEISLVDRPANPSATIDLWKIDSSPEATIKSGESGEGTMPDGLGTMETAFAEALAKTQQFWRCNNPAHMHMRKDEAADCMAKAATAAKAKTRPQVGDPQADADTSQKTGLPDTPPIKPGDPPGAPSSEGNFDGDADSDDKPHSAESAGHGFSPESASDRASDFGKKGSDGANKKPYGDVTYADPGYKSDGKKRYPVDTDKHVRAAWSYINQGNNARGYTSEQLANIKGKIRAAAKEHGIEISEKAFFDLGDPEALIKALASVCFDDLLEDLPYDGIIEKAGKRQSAADAFMKQMVHDAIGKLTDGQFCQKAVANAAQDTGGSASHAAPTESTDSGTEHYHQSNAAQDTSKRGARHNAETLGFMRKAHNAMCKAGASCPAHDDVNKASTTTTEKESAMGAETLTADDGALKSAHKKIGKLEKAIAAMQVHMEYMANMAKTKDSGSPPPAPLPPVVEKNGKLKKAMSEVDEKLAAIAEKVAEIAKQPIPAAASQLPPGILDISKSQDGLQGAPPAAQVQAAEEVAKRWEALSPDERFAASYWVTRQRPYTQQR